MGRAHHRSRQPDRGALACAALLLVLGGCEAGSGAPERAVPSPALPPSAQSAGVDSPDRIAPPPTTALQAVDWPLAGPIDRDARAALTTEAIAAIDRAPVPVLVPSATEGLQGARILVGPHWFSYAGTRDGLTLSVRGTRLAHRYSGVASAEGRHRVRGSTAFVSQDQRIWSVSWREHGLAYSLDVECAAADDPRCADEGFALGLADRLRYVGGEGSRVQGVSP